jgi:hypothetical protein
MLSKFIEKLAGMFTIEEEGNSLTVKGVQSFTKPAPCSASYFVGSEITYAVDLTNGKICELSGYQEAGGVEIRVERLFWM